MTDQRLSRSSNDWGVMKVTDAPEPEPPAPLPSSIHPTHGDFIPEQDPIHLKSPDDLNTFRLRVEKSLNSPYSLKKPRPELPANKSTAKISIFQLMKENIGKDLSRVTLPVVLNEPISFLQRCVEDMEYSELLDTAATATDPWLRLVYVAAFAVSGYNSTSRVCKPFNPILGETYDLVHAEKGFRAVVEQVSHHPPVSALHVESKNYLFWTSIYPKNKFWGKSIEVHPTGRIKLKLLPTNEYITWHKITTCVHNIILGSPWIDHYGTMELVNHTNGGKCILNFLKPTSWFSTEASLCIQGFVYDNQGKQKYKITGKWTEGLSAQTINGTEEGEPFQIWKVKPAPEKSTLQFLYTHFTVQLNQLTEEMKPFLPPTDSRLRPDQRALENCTLDLAAKEKSRLEDKQRSVRKLREKEGVEWDPRWFKIDSSVVVNHSNTKSSKSSKNEEEVEWVYKGGYWEAKDLAQWPEIPDIF